MNITVIVALVAAISAIVAPTVTEIIRSRNELKLKKLEMVYPVKQRAYQNLANVFGQWSASKDSFARWTEVVSAISVATVLAEKSGRNALQELVTCPIDEREAMFQNAISTQSQELSSLH